LINTFLAALLVFCSIGRVDLVRFMLVIGEHGADKQILIDCFYVSEESWLSESMLFPFDQRVVLGVSKGALAVRIGDIPWGSIVGCLFLGMLLKISSLSLSLW